jgi:hypothetical protein
MSYLDDLDPTPDNYQMTPHAEPPWDDLRGLDVLLLGVFSMIGLCLIVIVLRA